MNVKIIKLITGEILISEYEEIYDAYCNSSHKLTNPVTIFTQEIDGMVQGGFLPYLEPFIDSEEVFLLSDKVMFVAPPTKQIEEKYTKMFSNIITPSNNIQILQ